MGTLLNHRMEGLTNRGRLLWRFVASPERALLLAMLACFVGLSGCGGSSSSGNGSQIPLSLAGNWQFTMGEQLNSDPTKPSFSGGLQGGFLLQNNSAVSGQANFLIMTQPPLGSGGQPTPCNSGTDVITGTLSGQSVNLTAKSSAGQTFTLTGTLDFSGTTMSGTYTSTDGAGCGIVAAQSWTATNVPPLTGSIQGIFHSMGGSAGLNEQDFLVSGNLLQAANSGASNATVTGNLRFVDPTTTNTDYPCLALASVTGTISGNSVYLQLTATGGAMVGQIGQNGPIATSGPQTVTFNSTGSGYALQSLAGAGYAVYTSACGGGTLQIPADAGSVCLAVNNTTACQPPISLSPAALAFPPQAVGSKATSLSIDLANPNNSELDGVTLALSNTSGPGNFSETDTCGVNGAASKGQAFVILPKMFCTVTISYSPKQSCAAGTSSGQCLTGTLTVTAPTVDTILNVPLTGGVTAD